MAEYWPPGPKEEEYREYQKLKFIKEQLATCPEDQVEDFSSALHKIMKWIQVAIDLRVEDVKQRRESKVEHERVRKEAQDKEKERMDKRTAAFTEAKNVFTEKNEADWATKKEALEEGEDLDEAEKPQFDEDEWYAAFDDDNPPVDIPEELEQDQDNDFNIPVQEATIDQE